MRRVNVLRPHSIILASCKPGCKPGFRPGLQPGFRQVRAGLRHAFDFDLLHQSRHVEIDAAGSLVRACVRQMECRKTRFEPANEPVEAGFSFFIIRAYHDVIK